MISGIDCVDYILKVFNMVKIILIFIDGWIVFDEVDFFSFFDDGFDIVGICFIFGFVLIFKFWFM